jgi:hypothetical protein
MYPPKGCEGTRNCVACFAHGFTFVCAVCGKSVAWCFGCDDEMWDACDDCWATEHSPRDDKVV